MAECAAACPNDHIIQLPVSILRELARRLQLIQKFRNKFLTKTELEIQNSVRSEPLRAEQSTPVWWCPKSDVELLLGCAKNGLSAWGALRFSNEVVLAPASTKEMTGPETLDPAIGSAASATDLAPQQNRTTSEKANEAFLIARFRQLVDPKEASTKMRKPRTAKLTLSQLIENKVITPGMGTISVRGKESTINAELTGEGKIVFNGVTFKSPSAFSQVAFGRRCSGWVYTMYRSGYSGPWRSLAAMRESYNDRVVCHCEIEWSTTDIELLVAQLFAVGAPMSNIIAEDKGQQDKIEVCADVQTKTGEVAAAFAAESGTQAKVGLCPCPAFSLGLEDWIAQSKVNLGTKTTADFKSIVEAIVAAAEATLPRKKSQATSSSIIDCPPRPRRDREKRSAELLHHTSSSISQNQCSKKRRKRSHTKAIGSHGDSSIDDKKVHKDSPQKKKPRKPNAFVAFVASQSRLPKWSGLSFGDRMRQLSATWKSMTSKEKSRFGREDTKRTSDNVKGREWLVKQWSTIFNRVKSQLSKVKFAHTFIATYENGTWSGNPTRREHSKFLPRAQLDHHRRQILKSMVKIRAQVRNLSNIYAELSTEARSTAQLNKYRVKDVVVDEAHSNGWVDVEGSYCCLCESKEVSTDNDILLCDGPCQRAYHQMCVSPPVKSSDIPPGDDDWYCPQCLCALKINAEVNRCFGTDFDALHPEQLWPCVGDDATIVLPRPQPINEDLKPSVKNDDHSLLSKAKTEADRNPSTTSVENDVVLDDRVKIEADSNPSMKNVENDVGLDSRDKTGTDANPSMKAISDSSLKSKADSTPEKKSAPPPKSAADVEYERLCYEHMLTITRAADPEEDDELSSEDSIGGVGSKAKSSMVQMDVGQTVLGERKSKSKAIACLSFDEDANPGARIPMEEESEDEDYVPADCASESDDVSDDTNIDVDSNKAAATNAHAGNSLAYLMSAAAAEEESEDEDYVPDESDDCSDVNTVNTDSDNSPRLGNDTTRSDEDMRSNRENSNASGARKRTSQRSRTRVDYRELASMLEYTKQLFEESSDDSDYHD